MGYYGAVHAVAGGVGQEADLFDLVIHALLEQGVKPGTFRLDLGEIGEFGADADDVGMTAVVGQPELLAVGGFQNDGHRWLILSCEWRTTTPAWTSLSKRSSE